MPSFAPWSAALAGFRLVRERPLAVLAWAGVIFLGRQVALTLITMIAGKFMPALDAAVNAKTIDPEAVLVAYQAVAPGYVAGGIALVPFGAIVIAAIYRAYLRPDESRWCFLRLGSGEAAILVLILCLELMAMGGLAFAGALIGALANLAATAGDGAGAMVELLGLAASVCAVVWGLVRLSIAWPMTFQAGRLVLFPSWARTRSQGWTLLAAFVLAEGLMAVVAVLLFSIWLGLTGAAVVASGGAVEQIGDALRPPSEVAQLFAPMPLVFSAFQSLLLALGAATLAGVAVSAYHSLDVA